MLKPPPALVHHLREKRCVLFCGAGLSAWAKLPTWKTLLKEIVEQTAAELGDDSVLTELNQLLDADRLLDVADHCQEALGDRRFGSILSTRLRGASEPIPEPHRVIVNLPFSAIITTNYDKLLERAYASVAGWPKTPTSVDVDQLGPLLFDDGFFILKAHGDIDRADSMVLTTRDYQTIIHSNQAFNAIFSAVLLTKAILFVGYSLNDPDFRLLMDKQLTVFRGSVPERYALMSGVGKIESNVLWRTARIRVLPYERDRHEQVLEFLQALHQQVSDHAPKIPGAIDDAAALKYVAPPRAGSSKSVKASEQPRVSSVSTMPQLSISQSGKQITAMLDFDDVVVQGASEWLPLEKLANRTADALSSVTKARLMGSMLAEVLPTSVSSALEQLTVSRHIALRLSPEVELLPWEWLQVSNEFLVLRNPVVRIPNAVTSSARGYPKIHSPVRVLLIGDPNCEDKAPLPGASAEVVAIGELYRKRSGVYCKSLLGPDASFDNVAAELTTGHYNIVHFAGHAWFDDLEPFIFLSGTVKLQASELRSLLNPHPPAILFLNSHFTIFAPPGASSDSSSQIITEEQRTSMRRGQRGFTDAVSVAGVGCLIGTFSGSLEDTVAKQIGLGFHQGLLEGLSIAHSLHKALVAAAPTDPANTSHISYAMSGYGDITLPPPAWIAKAGD